MSNAAGGCSLQMHACSWPFTCNSPSARDGESFSTFAECRYLLSAEGVKQRKAGERYDGMRKWCELEHWIASPSERLLTVSRAQVPPNANGAGGPPFG